MPVNHQIVYHLQDALNLIPDLNAGEMTKSFVKSSNDQLLVVYLSSLVRAVIALHALVDNKATIGRAELEAEDNDDGKKEETKKDGTEKSEEKSEAEQKGH